jgi:hypothetical protein
MDIKENVILINLARDRKEWCTPSNMAMNFPLHKEENFGHRTDYLVSTRISLELIFTAKYGNSTHFGTSSTILYLTTVIIRKDNYKYCHHGVDRVDKCWT